MRQPLGILIFAIIIWFIGYGCGITSPPSWYTDDSTGTTPKRIEGQGEGSPVKYRIVIDTAVTVTDNGNEIPLTQLQKQIEVDADGILGAKTVRRVLDLNRTEIGHVQELIK